MAINTTPHIHTKTILLILLSLFILLNCTNTKKSKFTVKNESNETLHSINIYVANKHFIIQELLPRMSISKTFLSMDSRYRVTANFSSTKVLKNEGHYVSSGILYDDIIFIDSEKIRIISSF